MLRVTFADIGALELQSAAFPLSAYRRERLGSVRSPLARRQGIGAELLLCRELEALGLKTPPELITEADGKPRLRGGELFFSLSHSGPWALCAVSDRELGADIQERKPCSEKLARRFFAPEDLGAEGELQQGPGPGAEAAAGELFRFQPAGALAALEPDRGGLLRRRLFGGMRGTGAFPGN